MAKKKPQALKQRVNILLKNMEKIQAAGLLLYEEVKNEIEEVRVLEEEVSSRGDELDCMKDGLVDCGLTLEEER